MKWMTMLQDLVGSLFQKSATYPVAAPERMRGQLHWDPANCTGCSLCAKDCPADALEVIVLDRKAKRFVMRYDRQKCIFCAQCVESCRFGCLELARDEWSLVKDCREAPILYGREEDINDVVADDTTESDQ